MRGEEAGAGAALLRLHPQGVAGRAALQGLRVDRDAVGLGRAGVAGRHDLHAGAGRAPGATAPRSEWPQDPEVLAQIQKECQGEHGDRRQELVLIGIGMDEAALRAGLDHCLLSDEEWALRPAGGARFRDPLLPWDIDA